MNLNRRNFLTGTLAMGATVAAAGTNGSQPVAFPDYTRGAWKTTPSAPLATFRPGVIDLNPDSYRKNKEAMKI